MLTALGVLGGALGVWQAHRAIDFWHLKSTLREGRDIADAILEDQKELNWAGGSKQRQD